MARRFETLAECFLSDIEKLSASLYSQISFIQLGQDIEPTQDDLTSISAQFTKHYLFMPESLNDLDKWNGLNFDDLEISIKQMLLFEAEEMAINDYQDEPDHYLEDYKN